MEAPAPPHTQAIAVDDYGGDTSIACSDPRRDVVHAVIRSECLDEMLCQAASRPAGEPLGGPLGEPAHDISDKWSHEQDS